MDESAKEVRFDRYCKLCKNKNLEETKDPCNDCLTYGMRDGTCKPEYFEPRK